MPSTPATSATTPTTRAATPTRASRTSRSGTCTHSRRRCCRWAMSRRAALGAGSGLTRRSVSRNSMLHSLRAKLGLATAEDERPELIDELLRLHGRRPHRLTHHVPPPGRYLRPPGARQRADARPVHRPRRVPTPGPQRYAERAWRDERSVDADAGLAHDCRSAPEYVAAQSPGRAVAIRAARTEGDFAGAASGCWAMLPAVRRIRRRRERRAGRSRMPAFLHPAWAQADAGVVLVAESDRAMS